MTKGRKGKYSFLLRPVCPLSFLPSIYTKFPFKVYVILWPFKFLTPSHQFPSIFPTFGSPRLLQGVSPFLVAVLPSPETPTLCLDSLVPFPSP